MKSTPPSPLYLNPPEFRWLSPIFNLVDKLIDGNIAREWFCVLVFSFFLPPTTSYLHNMTAGRSRWWWWPRGKWIFSLFLFTFHSVSIEVPPQVPPSSLGLESARHPPGEGKKEAISKYGFPVFYYLMGRTFETEMFACWMLTSFYDRFVAFASTAVECYHYADGQVNICLFHHTWRPGSEKSSSRSLIVIIGFRKYWL